MFSSSQCVLRQAATSLRHELRHQRFHRLVCVKAAAQHSSSQALEPASSTDDTTSSTSVSNGTTSAVPPLSDITLTELKSDISTAMWNEQMVLADQPGVCNLSLGYPDYAGSRLAREAAAAATVEPTLVRLVCCNFCKWKSSVL